MLKTFAEMHTNIEKIYILTLKQILTPFMGYYHGYNSILSMLVGICEYCKGVLKKI